MTPNELLAGGYRMGRQMVQLMCDDLTDDEFRHQPVPGANSAAWIVGHLAVVARRTADRLGATDLPVADGRIHRPIQCDEDSPRSTQTELGSKDRAARVAGCVRRRS